MKKSPSFAAINNLSKTRDVLCSNGHPTMLRHKRTDLNSKFWGCIEYPACTQTEPYNYEDKLVFIKYYDPDNETDKFSAPLLSVKKYHNAQIEQKLSEYLYNQIIEYLGNDTLHQIDFFVSIPGHDGTQNNLISRVFKYDPMRTLAYVPDMLISQPRKSQREANTLENREKNSIGKFSLRDPASASGSNICVIDDIVTSGWTMDFATNCIYEASRQKMYAAALAKTKRSR